MVSIEIRLISLGEETNLKFQEFSKPVVLGANLKFEIEKG